MTKVASIGKAVGTSTQVAVVEMPSGHQWLQRLVWAVVYVFGVKHGIGNDTLSEFFQLLRLERHWVSPSALQGCTSQAGKADSELSKSNKSCSKSQQS